MEILIGADPEVFVFDKASNTPVNAFGMVEGTKEQPFPVPFGAVQVDGMALEFNIAPASNAEEFLNNIEVVQEHLRNLIDKDRYNLVPVPSVLFSQEVMDDAPFFSKMLGCDPDFNAWEDGKENPSPSAESNMRTGAGHVHIGWGDGFDYHSYEHVQDSCAVIKQLDCSLGVQSVLWDTDMRRRVMYGRAGAFRPKSYGAEYRVLSNSWLTSKKLVGHVYEVARKSVEDLMNGIHYFEGVDPTQIINTSDVGRAKAFADNITKSFGVPAYV